MPRRSLFAMLPALLTACSAVDVLNATVADDTYTLYANIAYANQPRQKLDVYRPKNTAKSGAPMVIFFYGGSWSSGDRADYRFVGEALASKGIVAVIADYRLSPDVRYPAFVQDSALAVRWAVDHASDWGASPQRIYVMGHSAGAYNAAMLALDAQWLAEVQLTPQRLAGWIGIAGPYDFLPIGDSKTQLAFEWPNTPAHSQPLFHAARASQQTPPALLLAPLKDTVVDPIRSTVGLAKALRMQGVSVEMSQLDNVSHVTIVASIASILRDKSPVLERIVQFTIGPKRSNE